MTGKRHTPHYRPAVAEITPVPLNFFCARPLGFTATAGCPLFCVTWHKFSGLKYMSRLRGNSEEKFLRKSVEGDY